MTDPHRPAIRLLGPPGCLDVRSGAWHRLSDKAAALLALLLVDGPAMRSTLAALLWADTAADQPEKARNSLSSLLRDMRRWTGADLVQGSDTLALAPGVAHDLGALVRLPADGEPLPTGILLATTDLARLPDFSTWLAAARGRWQRAVAAAHDARADQLWRARRLPEALAVARQRVDASPLDEAGHRLLLRLLAAHGDRDGAAQAYAHCCQLLQQHADAEPAQATRTLATAIALGNLGPHEPAAPPHAALAPQQLVGRGAELHALRQAVASTGRLLLDGEPGVGKTRLLAALADGQPGVLQVSALAGDAEAPFDSLTRLLGALPGWLARAGQGAAARRPWPRSACDELARLMPDWGTPPARQAQAHRLVQALRDLLATCHAQGLQAVLVDDLQWADSASLGLLLGAASAAGGPAWVLAQRSGALPAPLQAVVDTPDTPWQRLPLLPLQIDGVLALLRASPLPVADAPAWAAVLQARSLGNPLHLLETLAALRHAQGDAVFRQAPPPPQALPVPATLDALLQARVDRLDPAARQLALLAALAGNLFSFDLAMALMVHTDAFTLGELWASLNAALVLRDGQLAHDSLRQPLLNAWPEPVRNALHAQVAEAAASRRAPAADVALHWQLAGQWSAAAAAYAQAAAEAFALGARAAEHQLWQRAATCHARLGRHDAAFSAGCQAADAALAALPPGQVDALLAALADAVRQPLQQADVDILRARLALTRYQFAEALPACRTALAALEALPPPEPLPRGIARRRLRASCLLAAALAGSGAQAEALARVEADAEAVRCADDRRLQLDHAGTQAYVLVWAGRMAEAEAAYHQALDHARALDDPAETSVLATNLAQRVLQRGAVRDALDLALEATDALRSMGRVDGVAAASAHLTAGGIRWRLGHYSQALDDLGSAQALLAGEAAMRWRMSCEVFIAQVWLDLGCVDQAQAALSPWPDDLATGRLQRGLVELAIARQRAEPVLDRLLAWQGDNAGDTLPTHLMLQLAIAREQAVSAALDRCRSVADRALAAGLLGVQQAAWFQQADALQQAGQPMLALQCLLPALGRLDNCAPQAMYPPRAWWIAHQVFSQAGQDVQAADALVQGLRWVHDTARHRVPLAQRDSFLQRNPVNRALLLAGEVAGLAPPA